MEPLSEEEVQKRIGGMNGWDGDVVMGVIQKEFQFSSFSEAMNFMNAVAEVAEKKGHHPDMCVSYASVVCMLSTHEAGGITQKDFDMADEIEKIADTYGE